MAGGSVVDGTKEHGDKLMAWLKAHPKGYLNPKVELRRAVRDDPSSMYGVFANEDLAENETILVLPRDYILDGHNADDPEEEEYYMFYVKCQTVENLLHELRLGSKSRYGPYIEYILDQPYGQLPSGWSEPGMELLLRILGNEQPDKHYGVEYQTLPPFDPDFWIHVGWLEQCEGLDDPLARKAALTVVQRGWDEFLLPIIDVFNHRNGHWTNAAYTRVIGANKDVKMFASKPIKAGQEIYNSYNHCGPDCGYAEDGYATPEMFRDYGFVENYPRRWVFFNPDFISFDIDENVDTGALELTWNKDGFPDTDESLNFLRGELKRLRDFQPRMEANDGSIPPFEWNGAKQYYEGLVEALSMALDSASAGNAQQPIKQEL